MRAMVYLALATFGLIAFMAIEVYFGARSMTWLRDVEPPANVSYPKLSILVAARNEERNIEAGVMSLLAQDYPNREIVVIDDRSTDSTGAILDGIAKRLPELRVVHVKDLPPGWLGKNHALFLGAGRASGELLLFTDADIIMEPSAVRRAVYYLRQNGIDHLTLSPGMHCPGTFLQFCVSTFTMFLGVFLKPWKARDPKSRFFIGVGAFNLIRREAYDGIGTHRAIALRPDDDMKFGKLVKLKGFRQDILWAPGMVMVEWYASFRELVHGLEKNMFAGSDYRLWFVVLICLFSLTINVLPWVAVFFTSGAARAAYAGVVAMEMLMFCDNTRFNGGKKWLAIFYPFGSLIHIFLILNSTWKTLSRGGIEWRGTHYPLRELKENRV